MPDVTGLSLRAGGQGFPPPIMSMTPKLKENRTKRTYQQFSFPPINVYTQQLKILVTTLCSHKFERKSKKELLSVKEGSYSQRKKIFSIQH